MLNLELPVQVDPILDKNIHTAFTEQGCAIEIPTLNNEKAPPTSADNANTKQNTINEKCRKRASGVGFKTDLCVYAFRAHCFQLYARRTVRPVHPKVCLPFDWWRPWLQRLVQAAHDSAGTLSLRWLAGGHAKNIKTKNYTTIMNRDRAWPIILL